MGKTLVDSLVFILNIYVYLATDYKQQKRGDTLLLKLYDLIQVLFDRYIKHFIS